MDPSRRHLLPATLHCRRSPSPPQLRRTSATPLASQSDGDGSGGYPPHLNPSSWSLGPTAGTSSGGGSSSRTPPNALSTPDFPPPSPAAPAIRFEGDPVSDDNVGHFFDLNELCGVTSEDDAGPEAGQVDDGLVDGKSIQITVLNSLVPELDSATFVLEQPALPVPVPVPSPVAGGAGRSRRRGSGASPWAGGAVKRSRATPEASHASPGEGGASPRAGGAVKRNRATPAASHAHASPGAGGAGSGSASAGPGGAGSNHLSIGSGASPEAGGGSNNGTSPGVGGAGSSSTPLSTTGSGAAALLELARELKLSEAQTETIIKDQGLAELVLTDRERARGRLRNRVYAATDRKNKANRKQELEQMIETLTDRISTLSTTLSEEQSKRLQIRTKNNELRLKVHSMENMAQLRDAQYKALTAEKKVWRAKYEAMSSRTPSTSCLGPKR